MTSHNCKFGALAGRKVGLALALLIFFSGCFGTSIPNGLSPGSMAVRTVKFHPLKPQSFVLPNGLQVLFLPDNELPLVSASLYIKGGTLWDPPDKLGLIGAMGSQLREGGTQSLSADALDLELEELAAQISSGFASEFGTIRFSCLRRDLDRVFSLFADVALRPAFDAKRLEILRGRNLDSIRRRGEDSGVVAGIAFKQLLYGNSAFGQVSLSKHFKAIKREDLLAMHSKLVRPERAILAISGAISADEAFGYAEKYLANWKRGELELEPPKLNGSAAPGLYFIKLPFPQATVQMGHLGVERLSPDYVAIDGFNNVFGVSVSSRLFRRVRTELGLSYGIYGGMTPGLVQGANVVAFSTRSESTGTAINESVKILQTMQNEAISYAELDQVKGAIANSFVFDFASADQVVKRFAELKLVDYPADYDDTYLDKVYAMSVEDILSVAQKRWDLSKFVVLVVGDDKAYNSVKEMLQSASETLPAIKSWKLHEVKFGEELIQ